MPSDCSFLLVSRRTSAERPDLSASSTLFSGWNTTRVCPFFLLRYVKHQSPGSLTEGAAITCRSNLRPAYS